MTSRWTNLGLEVGRPDSRSHRNTTRLTSRERAQAIVADYFPRGMTYVAFRAIQRAMQAHARQALRRKRARRKAGK